MLSRILKKRYFKKNVKQVAIEITSYCNRKCEYCPISIIDRERCKMNDSILNKILNELHSIKYNQSFCLNIYNEPLLDINHLFNVMETIRKFFPSNIIRFSTNGDVLTKEYIDKIFSFKHVDLIITCHIAPTETWDTYTFLQKIIEKKMLFDTHNFSIKVNPDSIHTRFMINENSVSIFARNFFSNGVDRASTMQHIVAPKMETRNRPCSRPTNDFIISYDGSVYPCCQFCHGVDKLAGYILGNVTEQDIFSIYSSQRMCSFRKMAYNGPYEFPCNTCRE